MTINEKIVTGRKFRRLIDKDSKLWQLISWWTKASDVEFDDGKTAEQKLGNINGITSDFNCEDTQIAASAALTNKINEDLGGCRFGFDEDGNPGFIITDEDGADTVRPFSSGKRFPNLLLPLVSASSNGILMGYYGDKLVALKSSGAYNSGRKSYHAFSANGAWLPPGADSEKPDIPVRNEWLAMEFENPINIQFFRFHNTNGSTSGSTISLQYCDPEDVPSDGNWYDNSNPWVSKGSVTLGSSPSSVFGTIAEQIIVSDDSSKHKYYRIFETKSVQIGHFELMNSDR